MDFESKPVFRHENPFWKWSTFSLIFGLLIIPVFTGWLFPFCYDDAYISFRITDHLVDFGKPFFNRDQAVYTSTSIFYPIWNAIWKITFGAGWNDQMGWINGMLQAGTLARIFYLLHKKSASYSSLFISILCIGPLVLGVNQLAIGNSGLETALYQFALAFTLLPSVFREKTFSFLPWLVGFIRPEGFLVGITRMVELVVNKSWKSLGCAAGHQRFPSWSS